MKTLVWFRGKDLRMADHGPLTAAAAAGDVIPLFVLDPYFFAPSRAAELPHRMQFLLESLESLAANLAHVGSRLVVVAGKSTEVVPRVAAKLGVDRVVAHRWCEPFARERDTRVGAALRVPFELFEGETLVPPGTLRTGGGTPYSVFTPFSRAWAKAFVPSKPLPAPKRLPAVPADLGLDEVSVPTLASLGLTKNEGLQPGGERNGRKRLDTFVTSVASRYHLQRDRMDVDGTSRLSADLKFGTVSARTIHGKVTDVLAEGGKGNAEALRVFVNELVWREFTHHTIWDRPELLEVPFRDDFRRFPYVEDPAGWTAWVRGATGYPVVDASARQLLASGFVHNRARMISASFLTKHLLVSYRDGEAHYMKWLTDGDWAQNDAGWQWSSGSGCDAQPYFRVFNPITQGEKFDPEGDYVRRWVPELSKLPAKVIHKPWEAAPEILRAAGVTLGRTYPMPIVDHAKARARFLAVATKHLRGGGADA
ncbi:MAG: deoxyribodipyrimidine photo-lyase [Polyangiaceae bacterium]